MSLILAKKFFDYDRLPADRIWLDAMSIFQTARRGTGRHELKSAELRRKRSLLVLTMSPDMAALRCMRAVRSHLLSEYGVRYDGWHNKFKETYDDVRTSELLGFMETIQAVFTRRIVEMDMVLKSHDKKALKVAHAIRDLGTFQPEAYERGREEGYKVLVLALPRPQKFDLLAGSELLAGDVG